MFNNISKLVNKITDRSTSRDGEGSGSLSFVDTEEQHSEGFLCPNCFRAFPSSEALEVHYNTTHQVEEAADLPSSNGSDERDSEVQSLREEIQNLHLSLAEEKESSTELKREFQKMQKDMHVEDDQAPDKALVTANSLLTSEVALLRQQLASCLEELGVIKKEFKEIFDKNGELKKQSEIDKTRIQEVESQKNKLEEAKRLASSDDASDQEKKVTTLEQELFKLRTEGEGMLEQLTLELNDAKQEIATLVRTADARINEINLAYKKEQEQGQATASKLSSVEEQLRQVSGERSKFSNECQTLKTELQRLTQRETELRAALEGEEGAHASLLSVKSDNDRLSAEAAALKQKNTELTNSLADVNANVTELSTNISILQDKHTTLQNEKTHLRSTIEAESEQKNQLLAQMKQKESELKTGAKKHQELQNEKDQLSNQLNKMTAQLSTHNQTIKELEGGKERITKELSQKESELAADKKKYEIDHAAMDAKCRDISTAKEEISNRLEVAVKQKELLVHQLEEKVKATEELQQSLQKLQSSLERQAKKCLDLTQALDTSDKKKQELETSKEKLRVEHAVLEGTFKTRIVELENNMENESRASASRVKELEDQLSSKLDALQKSQEDLESMREKQTSKDNRIKEMEIKHGETLEKCHDLESQTHLFTKRMNEVVAEKLELEKKVKGADDEKALLLEKCLAGESEVEQLQQRMTAMQRKLDDSHAALQELGRENQSLQMESAKLQGRKWADDSLVNACSTCGKEFTLTTRKHHCRNCGFVVCQSCSSRTAAVPSCKKPARVCDPCYQELLIK